MRLACAPQGAHLRAPSQHTSPALHRHDHHPDTRRPLADRVAGAARVTIVLGKGGVGKTTVAAALALDWARAGEKVLLTSVSDRAELARRVRQEGQDLPPTLTLVELDPRGLVDDLVRRAVRLGPLAEAIVRHPAYDSIITIAPGIREMAMLDHVWERRDGFDRVVLDAPATGHGLHFLEAPRRTEAMVVGKLRERATALRKALEDPSQTDIVLVTLAEETPVRETRELASTLAAQGFRVDNVVVNRWFPDVFDDAGSRLVLDTLDADAAAREGLQRAIARYSRIDIEDWVGAARLVRGQRDEHRENLDALRGTAQKIALVPFLPQAEGRLAAVARSLSEVLA
ncbi:MAG TPA: ArsA family ATPase [Candidatus Thermoplasmatota archaeon]|nr:ArsA family ATPase [Candidatus Thermoplasmatota archaeon]